MIELSKGYCPKAEFYVKDIMKPLNLGIFDGVFAKAVLLHIPKAKVSRVLSEFRNSLKEKGYLYIAVKEQRQNQKEEQIMKENDYGYEYERFFSFFTLPELKDYLNNLSMKIVFENVLKNGNTNWIIIIAQR